MSQSSRAMSIDHLTYPSPEVTDSPYPFFEAMREQRPVYKIPGRNDYIVSRHSDLVWAAGHPEIFTNVKQWVTTHDPDLQAIAAEQRCPTMPVIVDADPPVQTRNRAIAFRAFTPKRLREYAPRIATVVHDLLDDFPASGEVEFVEAFCNRLPMTVIVDILGLSRGMMPQYKTWSDEWAELSGGFLDKQRALHCQRTAVDFNNYVTARVEERLANPGDDVISELVHVRKPDGDSFDLTELTNIVRLLLIAGNETTAFMLANTMLRFLERPDQLDLVRADRRLVPRALEESLRLTSPTQWSWRTCIRDTELGGTMIPAGARVLMMWASGNRDPAAFAEPDQFDVRRGNVKSHLAFGKGIHFCLGAPLSRLEGEIAFNAIFDRFGEIHSGQPLESVMYIDSPIFRAPRELWLKLDRRRSPAIAGV